VRRGRGIEHPDRGVLRAGVLPPGVSAGAARPLFRLLATAICFARRVRDHDSRLRDDEQSIPAPGSRLAPHCGLITLSAARTAPERRRFDRPDTGTGLHVVRASNSSHGFGPRRGTAAGNDAQEREKASSVSCASATRGPTTPPLHQRERTGQRMGTGPSARMRQARGDLQLAASLPAGAGVGRC